MTNKTLNRVSSVPRYFTRYSSRTLSAELDYVRGKAHTLLAEDILMTMPMVRESVVEDTVREIFEPLTWQIEELTDRI